MSIDNPAVLLVDAVARGEPSLNPARFFDQFHFAPTSLTFEGIFTRLADLALAGITFANVLAVLGAICFVATLLMRTMVPLRVAAIISNVFFVSYGALSNSFATFIIYLLLLPINVLRLYQMLKLVKKARLSAQGDLSMDWLKPFMNRRSYPQGAMLFRKGDPANEMFFIVTGKFLVTEIGIELESGRILGELGFLSPSNRRTQTVECVETGDVLTISYEKLLEIYFQNPEFGYYFLRLSSERLLQNVARLEAIIEQHNIRVGGDQTPGYSPPVSVEKRGSSPSVAPPP
jgi:cyclic nucleotide-binding protein